MACPTCDRVRNYLNQAVADSMSMLRDQGLARDQLDPASGNLGVLGRVSFAQPTVGKVAQEGVKAVRRATRKESKQRKAMSKAMKWANERGKLKNGNWRAGWDRSRCMREAHKKAKEMCR